MISETNTKNWLNGQINPGQSSGLVDDIVLTKAVKCFAQRGIPGRKDEEYKYSDTIQLFDKEMIRGMGSLTGKEFAFSPMAQDVYRIVCLNGIFQPNLSVLPAGIEVCLLSEAKNTHSLLLKTHLGKISSVEDDPFSALNTLQFSDGLFIRVPKNFIVDKPIELLQVFESLDDKSKTIYLPRNFFVVEQGASMVIFENGQELSGENNVLKVAVSEVIVEENATLKYYRLQNESVGFEQINDLSVHAAANSHVDTNTISLGSSWIRNNLTIRLNGTNAEAHLNGLFISNARQHMDHHTLVDHRAAHCESNQIYKGVLNGRSTGVFNGKIFVRKDAQKTNAYQSSKNILLSDDATVNTKPQLEIYADDVKCSHGSSTGQLDEQSVFYLQARGIGKELAIKLLIHAFALDVIETIREEKIRVYLADLIGEALNQNKK